MCDIFIIEDYFPLSRELVNQDPSDRKD